MDETFSGWVEAQLEAWVSEVEARLGIPLDVAPASTDAGEDTRHAATVS
jgi:hypothetical protein